MTDSLKKRGDASENEYFTKKNQEALERLQVRQENESPRKSPITGEDMEQLTIMGVVVDKCKTSNGVWLDAGELEQILEASKKSDQDHEGNDNFISRFLGSLSGR